MTWDQFTAGVLSLALVAITRLVDHWLPATTPPTIEPEARNTSGDAPEAPA